MADYSLKGHYYLDRPRREVMRLLGILGRHAHVLDIGAGYGNNAKLLLSYGHSVVALEANEDAVGALLELQEGQKGRLLVKLGSVDTYRSQQDFDAVVCCMVLHFIEGSSSARTIVRQMQAWTKPGGINLITSYLDTNDLGADYTFLLQHNQLLQLYDGWEIVWYEESYAYRLRTVRGLMDLLRVIRGQKGYRAARIIARKPEQVK